MNSNFGDGIYTFTISGKSLDLNLSGNAFPNTPLLTLSGGTWDGGEYILDISKPLTIVTNVFLDYGTHLEDIIAAGIEDVDAVPQFSTTTPSSNSLSYTLPAYSLTAGKTYTGGAQFTSIVDWQTVDWLDGSINYASYFSNTEFTIRTVPEQNSVPEPNSAILLALGLISFISFHRQRNSWDSI